MTLLNPHMIVEISRSYFSTGSCKTTRNSWKGSFRRHPTLASPIVLRKPDGNVAICKDYPLRGNHKVCSDCVALHSFAGMNRFAKIDLKIVYHQSEIHENFKEITAINTTCTFTEMYSNNSIFQRVILKVWEKA